MSTSTGSTDETSAMLRRNALVTGRKLVEPSAAGPVGQPNGGPGNQPLERWNVTGHPMWASGHRETLIMASREGATMPAIEVEGLTKRSMC